VTCVAKFTRKIREENVRLANDEMFHSINDITQCLFDPFNAYDEGVFRTVCSEYLKWKDGLPHARSVEFHR